MAAGYLVFDNRTAFTDELGRLTPEALFRMQSLLNIARSGGLTTLPATSVTVSPTGGITSTDAQAALAELDAEKVPTTRTVNGHALNANVTLTAADVGASTVSTVSVVTANGFAGTVTTPTTTPAITLTTSITGLLNGNGTAISAAVAGTDYVAPTTTVNGHALSSNVTVTASDVGLGSVTNDAQTKAAIAPNTAPAAGQLLVGNSGGTAYAPVSLSGDATLSSAGALTIGAQAVTLAKLVNASATSRVLLRKTAGAGSWEEGTASDLLAFLGNTQGQILIRDGSGWNVLSAGTAGQFLKTGGAGANPSWAGTKEMLANVTSGAGATAITTGTFAARRFLEVHILLAGYAGSDTAGMQFNATNSTVYRYIWSTLSGATVAAGLAATSANQIKIDAANTTNSRRVVAHISNDSTLTEKLVRFESVFGTTSAGTQATSNIGNGAFISGASTQITRIDLISTSNMLTGTQIVVFGWN